jgi:hypothetical protein
VEKVAFYNHCLEFTFFDEAVSPTRLADPDRIGSSEMRKAGLEQDRCDRESSAHPLQSIETN